MHKPIHILLLSTLLLGATGCAAINAGKRPRKIDLSFLEAGTPRRYVLAELGPPIESVKLTGGICDRYSFQQGYSKHGILWWQIGHVLADVSTYGLWEFVGGPIESKAKGATIELRVVYDSSDRIADVTGIAGMDMLPDHIRADDEDSPKATPNAVSNDTDGLLP